MALLAIVIGLGTHLGIVLLQSVYYNSDLTFLAHKILVHCNLDLVTLLVFAKTVTKSHNITKSNDFM